MIEKIPFDALKPGQVFRWRGHYYACKNRGLDRTAYRMAADWSGYYKVVGFSGTTLVTPSPTIHYGPLPTPRSPCHA